MKTLARLMLMVALVCPWALSQTGTFPNTVSVSGSGTITLVAGTHGNRTILADCTGADTIAVPSAVDTNFMYYLKRTNAAAGNCTIDPSGTQTVDGAATYILSSQYASVWLVTDGSNWHILSKSPPTGGSAHTIQEEGVSLTSRTNLNFVGPAITATDDAGNDQTDVTVLIDNSTVPDDLTLTNITQITNRAISDTTGTLLEPRGGTGESTYTLGDSLYSDAANSLAKLAGNITTAKQFLTQTGTGAVSAAPAWGAIADGDIPAAIARDAEINVQGTANEITSSGSGVAPTLSLAAQLNISGKEIMGGSTPLKFEGTTDDNVYTTVTITDPTLARTFTLPNANSVAVQPLTCSSTDKVSAVSVLGLVTCSADVDTNSGGTVTSVSGTANEIGSTGGTTPVISLAAQLNLSGKEIIGGATPVRFESTTDDNFYSQFTFTDPTATRTHTFPNADSNTVQPATAPANQFATAISSAGVISFAQPSFANLSGTAADGQIDGSLEADELVLAGDVDGAANANDLDEVAVEAELEGVLDLADLQGDLALGTKTSGNYIQSLSNGVGLTGFPAAGESATGTPAFDFSDAGVDPTLGAGECRFSNEGASAAGWVCEGETANLLETRFRVTDPTGADRIVTIPDADSTTVQPDTGAANNFLTAISAAGLISKAQPAFSNLSGSATAGQLPNLQDLNGLLDVPSGGTGSAPGADDQAIISDSTSAATWRSIPNCVTNNMLTYTAATNTFGCDADDGAGGGAPVGAQYVVGATDATLTAEKVLTDGVGIDTVLAGGDGGSATINLDFSDAGASPTLAVDEARFTSNATVAGNLVFEGDTADGIETRIAITDPATADRTFTIPNADSNPVQPATAPANQFATAISSAGVISFAQPSFANLSGTAADGQVDGSGEADELVLAGDVDGTANANDLDEVAVETELEAVLDHDELQGFVANRHIDHSAVTLTAGAGLSGGGDITANRTFATASSEADFVLSGALTCGAATQGKLQVHTTPLQYCDNAATPVLQYAAYGASDGDASAGDSATAFFDAGTIEDARLSTLVSLLGQTIAEAELVSEDYGDFTCGAGADDCLIDADAVALTTDTTGNYVDDVTAGIGIAVTHTPAEGSDAAVAFTFADAGADPALGAGGATFSNEGASAAGLVFEGDTNDTFETRLRVTDPTVADRIVTIPNADSNTVQPLTCTGSDKVSAISALGVVTCTADVSGGTPAWESLVNSADTATAYTSNNTAETVTFSFESAFGASQQLLIRQQTGNPTAGTLLDVRAADAQVTVFRAGDGTNGITVSQAGALIAEGTGSITATVGDTATAFFSAGTLEDARLSANVVLENQANTYTTGAQDFTLATSLTTPVSAGAGPTASGQVAYDSTANALEYGDNTVNRTVANLDEAQTFTNKTASGALATTTHAAGANFISQLHHATDCTAITDGVRGELCVEEDSERLFSCQPTAGGCDTAGEWILSGDGAGGGNSFGTIGTAIADAGADTITVTDTLSIDIITTDAPEDLSAAFRYDQTQAGDPALAAENTIFTTDGTGGGGLLFEGTTADANEGLLQWNPTTDKILTLPDATDTLVARATTDTLTGKTIDGEGTGNAITLTSEIVIVAAGCDNATASKGLDSPTANGPSATCFGTAPDRFAYLDFADGASALTASGHFRLPTGWTGTIDLDLYWACSAGTCSTNSVSWNIQTICVANGEDYLNPTYNALQEIVDAGLATLHLRNEASLASVTTTGCAQEETFFFQINRDPPDASDTFLATAGLLEMVWTLRRTI